MFIACASIKGALPGRYPRSMNAPAPLLEVRDLHTYFLTEGGVARAVNGVSFTVGEGERSGLVGESGSGKSVTALSIMRLVDPPAGRIVKGDVRFRGRNLLDLSEPAMRKLRGGEIAMIFQDPMTSLDPVFTIGDQLVETIVIHRGLGKRAARKHAVAALEAVRIPQAARRFDDYPHQLSGGMRQRVVIAIALSCNPSLVIADEPTTALDVTTQAQILELLGSLARDFGTAVLLITHDLGIVAGFCDRVEVMYAGRIVEGGPVEEIYERPLHPYTWGLLGSVARLDRARSERLRSIRGVPPSPLSVHAGCPFQPRCEFADERSLAETPVLRTIVAGHSAACHRAGELALAERERVS
jgi:oligopeptide/dipeptide ABC transporter ATP-binding protein